MATAPKDALPLTFLVSETSADATQIYDAHAALVDGISRPRERSQSRRPVECARRICSVGPPSPPKAGAATSERPRLVCRSRVVAHIKGKDHWNRALLVARDTTHGFNSAQVGWLEGRLYDLLAAAAQGTLHNGNRPSDETLPQYERSMLEACVLPLSRVLRLLGYDTSPEMTVAAGRTPRQPNRYYGVELSHLVSAGVLKPDTVLYSTNSAWPAQGVVRADGGVVVNGVPYPTPSAAAASVKGGAANGWEFWAVDGARGRTALATLRTKYMERDVTPQLPKL